jgi:hypothetical protein
MNHLNPFLIEPLPSQSSSFLSAVQHVVDTIIPSSLWNSADLDTVYFRLASILPIFHHSDLDEESESLLITYLCNGEFTHLTRRYVLETITKWLIPGKQVEISGGINLYFHFAQDPTHKFFVAQEMISIRNSEENENIRKNLPDLLLEMKEKLASEFLRQTEEIIHPIFMPRNEEELIRNLIVLAAQIRYVRDLPQVSIHYEKQSDTDLTFTIIIARLLKGNVEPIRKVLEKTNLKFDIDDVRTMGYVKHKYPKETSILHINIEKRAYFRADRSVDLMRARQKIVQEVTRTFGEFRDFNGGMILKQNESLAQLREEVGKLSKEKEFLLENYFYSLKPAIMQTIHDTSVLQRHFELLNIVLKSDLHLQPYNLVAESMGKIFLCFIGAASPTFKEGVLNAIARLEISSRDLTTSFLEVEDRSAMGFLLRLESPEIAQQFQEAILQAFHEWTHRFYCPVNVQ